MEYEESKNVIKNKYDTELEEWKEMHAKRKEVRQRHKKHEKDMEKGRGSVDADIFAEDEEFLNNPEPEKPVPPEEFDEGKVKAEVESSAKLYRRNPGEPKLTLGKTSILKRLSFNHRSQINLLRYFLS